MESDIVGFMERDVCDGSAWSLKWGTLLLFPTGLKYKYNRPRKDAPDRMEDNIRLKDIREIRVEKMDWLVSVSCLLVTRKR